MSKSKSLGFNFSTNLSNIIKRGGIKLSSEELNVLSIACTFKEEAILETLVKSKNKEVCKAEALSLALGVDIQNKIAGDKLSRQLMENHDYYIDFTAEETEFLLEGMELYVNDIKSQFTNSKAANFEPLCLKIAQANGIVNKIDIYEYDVDIEEHDEEGAMNV